MENPDYIAPSSITLISKIIKAQNKDLIKAICQKQGLSETIEEELMDRFIKLNYYCPRKILDSSKEHLQKYFVDKY